MDNEIIEDLFPPVQLGPGGLNYVCKGDCHKSPDDDYAEIEHEEETDVIALSVACFLVLVLLGLICYFARFLTVN